MNTTQEEQILAAAYTCISREGYGNISLRQIAQEAGVAVSQISYHFKNKEGLLLAVIAQAAHKYHHLMQATIAEYQSPEEKGERLISLLKEALIKDSAVFRVIYDSAGLALFSDTFREKMQEVFAGIRRQIVEEVQHAVADPAEAAPMSRLMFGVVLGTAIQYLLEPEDPAILDSLDMLVRFFR
ncbi:MAG TPA: TetR/AcrR family transcriptional regulator [Firmicutes bacterium]|jgi:AcrR family transcriptional regulator|nr:MAG: hypothetical protein AA931_07885 [Peptococcaceae bacterium 1109]HHT73987.1 TetR/AcrR family transcriptional regulator [Bacillota bacterium]